MFWRSVGSVGMVLGTSMLVFCLAALASGQDPGQDQQPPDGGGGNDGGVEPQARGPIHEAFAAPVAVDPKPGFIVPKEPPSPIEEMPPDQQPDGNDVQWIPGYWAWDDDRADFLWISGFWRDLPPGRQWIPGYWTAVNDGWQWTSGYWAPNTPTPPEPGNNDPANTIPDPGQPAAPGGGLGVNTSAGMGGQAVDGGGVTYIPTAPPASMDNGPNVPQPSDGSVWVPGLWHWQPAQSSYIWQPGYWVAAQPSWVWVPSYYSWTPCGYVFVPGYWDYPIVDRGLLFAPCYVPPAVCSRPGFTFMPSVALVTPCLTNSLFCRPTYGHYYFGDFFAPSYANFGFTPWANFSYSSITVNRFYDPIFVHQRFLNHRRNPGWEHQLRADYHHRMMNPAARPPQTFSAVERMVRTGGVGAGKIGNPQVQRLTSLASNRDAQVRLHRLDQSQRTEQARRAAETRVFRDERRQAEVKAKLPHPSNPTGGPGNGNRPGNGNGNGPVTAGTHKVKLPTSPINTDRARAGSDRRRDTPGADGKPNGGIGGGIADRSNGRTSTPPPAPGAEKARHRGPNGNANPNPGQAKTNRPDPNRNKPGGVAEAGKIGNTRPDRKTDNTANHKPGSVDRPGGNQPGTKPNPRPNGNTGVVGPNNATTKSGNNPSPTGTKRPDRQQGPTTQGANHKPGQVDRQGPTTQGANHKPGAGRGERPAKPSGTIPGQPNPNPNPKPNPTAGGLKPGNSNQGGRPSPTTSNPIPPARHPQQQTQQPKAPQQTQQPKIQQRPQQTQHQPQIQQRPQQVQHQPQIQQRPQQVQQRPQQVQQRPQQLQQRPQQVQQRPQQVQQRPQQLQPTQFQQRSQSIQQSQFQQRPSMGGGSSMGRPSGSSNQGNRRGNH